MWRASAAQQENWSERWLDSAQAPATGDRNLENMIHIHLASIDNFKLSPQLPSPRRQLTFQGNVNWDTGRTHHSVMLDSPSGGGK